MKHLKKWALALAFLMMLTACGQGGEKSTSTEEKDSASTEMSGESNASNAKEENQGFKAGTYTAKATGHNGTLELSVEFSDKEIVAVNILKNEETETVTNIVFDTLPKEIVEKQTVGMDALAGATVTSNAIKTAVLDCIKQAGGDVDKFSMAEEKHPKDEIVELNTDVVVVGGGGSGAIAAMRADEAGLSVTLLEKNAMMGGHTALSGAYTLITGSKLQEEKYGITDDSEEAVYNDIMVNGGNKSIPGDLTLYCQSMGPATDWINDYVKAPIPDALTPLGENKIDRAMVYVGAGKGLNDALVARLKDTKVDVHLQTKVTNLLVEEGKVVGVEAVDAEGTRYHVRGAATVLATGSYGARKDLLPESLQNFVFYGAQLAQGEGMEMAQKIGADVVNQGYVELFENGVEWMPGIAKSTYNGSMATWDVSGILVDRNGKRVVNERAAGIEIVKEMAKQEDGRLFLFMDQKTFDAFRDNVAGYGISQEMLDGWLENNGKDMPYFAHADSIEDVAKIVSVDGEALKQTVETYNSYVENGVDEEFGRAPQYMKEKIGDGPYYLVEQKPRYATTLGGLKINSDLQVMNTDGAVIEGLYACGDVAGGARGDDSIPGSDVGWALASGYAVGTVLMEKLQK